MTDKTNLFFTIPCCLFLFSSLNAQQSKIDSLKVLIENEEDVSSKTNLLYVLGDTYKEPDSAVYYYTKARDYALEHQYLLGEAKYGSHIIEILNAQGKFREALTITQQTLEKYKPLDTPSNLAIAYLNVGSQWHYLSDFYTASEYYLKAKKIADSLGNKTTQRTINNNLCSVFTEMKQYEKAEEYGLEALGLAEELQDKWAMLSPLYNLAIIANYVEENEKALDYLDRFEQLAIELEDHLAIIDTYLAKGNIIGKEDLGRGIIYLNQAIAESQKHEVPESEFYAYLYLAEIHIEHKNYNQAIQNIEKGIPIAERLETKYELADFHKKASTAYEGIGDFEKALMHNREYEKLSDEMLLEENKNQILNLEAKYEFEQNEAEIEILNAKNQAQQLSIKQKNTLNYILVGTVLFVFITGFLLYKNYRIKQKIQKQRITELETEKQLYATDALLQGQEEERSRMARELHDGLGGLLSGVKINLNKMKKKLIITEEDGTAFENSLALLDQSINEMRRVAHNLMPESILRYGLDGAIKEFLESFDHEHLRMIYQSYNIENGINKQLDIATYRIIQEIVNNIIKHAHASEALVQVRKDENLLIIDVEDNGKGFELSETQNKNGMGLAGIQSRVNYWKGSLDIDSSKDKGTSIHIEIPL